MINKDELCIAIHRADVYLKYYGQKKGLNWFDMSHLLSFIFFEYTKEEILDIHVKQFEERLKNEQSK